MKKLFVYLKNYKKESILAPMFKLLEAFFDLLTPVLIANIINTGIKNSDSTYILQQFLLLIGLACVGMACSITAQYFAAKSAVGFTTDLRQALFDHIQSLSYSELDTVGTDTLITRLTSDCNQIQNGLNLALRLLLRSPFIVFGAMIAAFMINFKIALIFLVTIIILLIVVFSIMLTSIPLFKKVQKGLDKVLSLTRENLTGVRVIRAFHKEEKEVEEFDYENQLYTKTNEFVGKISALMNPLTYVIINIATIILIQQGAIQVNLGNLAQGDVVALYNYMAQIVVELIKLASLIITIDKSIACADRVQNVFEIHSSISYPTQSQTNDSDCTIQFDHVSFRYAGASENSLNDISFTLNKGQTLGIIGATGAGKSTLVNLIPRFYDASEGEVLIDGSPIQQYKKDDLFQKISIVPQKAVLFKGTIRENMKLGNENATNEEIWKALEISQAKEVVEEKEGQLDYMIEQNGRNLSGGQRQRLTIARAFVKDPEIILLDDSASALDFATDARLRTAISKTNITTVIVSQRTSSIKHADVILVLDDGNLVGKGTHEELMKDCHIYQEIYYSQFPEEKPVDFKMEVIA
jgi:ATP-binding cassette, subfamily B, multidrug efflux pump